jgi:hypothetical protein
MLGEEDISSRNKGLRKITGIQIPKGAIVFGTIAFCIFVVAGGIYDILENPPTIIPGPNGQFITIHPFGSNQTLYESAFVMITYSMMFLGLLLAHNSTKIAYDRKKANFFLIIGIILTLTGFAGNWVIIFLKRALLRTL